MSKRLLFIIAGIVVAAMAGFAVFSKSGSSSYEETNPAFSAYISAYTSGIISSESSIRILLTN
ncbi:MAG: hypothetical protein L6Q66_14180, partial [Bacteroidia bacterium]|nr:hypothetical protein [Bacteroidia bacterium]